MIAFILMGAAFLSLSMGFTGLPRALAEMIDSYNLSPVALIAVLTVFYLILGMFMDGLSSVVLTMAIVEPMIRAAGIDGYLVRYLPCCCDRNRASHASDRVQPLCIARNDPL